jgi:hypothetical protein
MGKSFSPKRETYRLQQRYYSGKEAGKEAVRRAYKDVYLSELATVESIKPDGDYWDVTVVVDIKDPR